MSSSTKIVQEYLSNTQHQYDHPMMDMHQQHDNPQMMNQHIDEDNIMTVQQYDDVQLDNQNGEEKRKAIYTYDSSSILYSISFQNCQECRFAFGTLNNSSNNSIEILEMVNDELTQVQKVNLEYPSTKLMWGPTDSNRDILVSSSDCIKFYKFNELDKTLTLTDNLYNKKSQYCGALTSFDWCIHNDSILGTASIDTTCAIWDLNRHTIKTQLIAHEKEVLDISFGNEDNIFISSGADGSVRLFDIRYLKTSTIMYESKDQSPITKIAWNLNNPDLIAALSWEKNVIYIFDRRQNTVSLVELKLHKAAVTGMVWSPSSKSEICSVSEDKHVIISHVKNDSTEEKNSCYEAPEEINNVSWCKSLPKLIAITFKKSVQLLRR